MSETTHEHCWHGTGNMLTSLPPQIVERCCHCGVEQRRPVTRPTLTVTEHGPYAPAGEMWFETAHGWVPANTPAHPAPPPGGTEPRADA